MVAQTLIAKQATIDFFQVLVHVVSCRVSHVALENIRSITCLLKVMVKALEVFVTILFCTAMCTKRNLGLREGLLRGRQGAGKSEEC